MDGLFQGGQILVDGGLQDGMCRVEVTVGEVIPHACDLPPGDGGLSAEQAFGQCLHGLADLQEADPYRVEDQAVGQVAALQVRVDGVDGGRMSASRGRSR